ncbi:MAG TPA: hypothetical protein DDY91_16330 [Planctomycetaceae bacterium]|nr:hypothetical protein [Planctomycetaceae bacterium]
MIEGSCGNCGVKYSVDNAHAGKKGQCRKCGARITIPEPEGIITQTDLPEVEEEAPVTPACQIATTDSIQGWTIVSYKGLVTAHIVAGTGFFSDFTARITDVFGGRSQTYQQQLAAIEYEAIDELRSQAMSRGANWVIGTRIDFDEISGKGMQMFMVSIQGTAVRAIPAPVAVDGPEIPLRVPGTVVREQIRKDGIRRRLPALEASVNSIPEEVLESICELRLPEAVPLCVRVALSDDELQNPRTKQLAKQALRQSPRQAARDAIHAMLLQNPQVIGANTLYRDLELLDVRWVLQQIEGPDKHCREVGLQVLSHGVAATYTEQDIPVIRALRDALPRAFPETAREVEVKGLLGGKGTKWRCANGHNSPMESRHCVTCEIDRHGLPRREFNLDTAIRAVDSTLTMLESVFRR